MTRVFRWGDLLLDVNKYLIDWFQENLPEGDFQQRISLVLMYYVHRRRNKARQAVDERVDAGRVQLSRQT